MAGTLLAHDCTGLQQLKQLTTKDLPFFQCIVYLLLMVLLCGLPVHFDPTAFLFTKLVTCFKTTLLT